MKEKAHHHYSLPAPASAPFPLPASPPHNHRQQQHHQQNVHHHRHLPRRSSAPITEDPYSWQSRQQYQQQHQQQYHQQRHYRQHRHHQQRLRHSSSSHSSPFNHPHPHHHHHHHQTPSSPSSTSLPPPAHSSSSLSSPSSQPHRLSIAERFMSPSTSTPETTLPNDSYHDMNDNKHHQHYQEPSLLIQPHSTPSEPTTDTDNDTAFTLGQSDYTATTANDSQQKLSVGTSSPKQQHAENATTKKQHRHQDQGINSNSNRNSNKCNSQRYGDTSPTITNIDEKPSAPWHSHKKQQADSGFWFCHRGCLLLCLFFIILILGFLLFLVWPRVPLLRIEGASVVSPVEIVQTQQGWMENVMLTTSWLVNVTVDNRQNYIPTRLNKVQVIVKDALTNALVGKGAHNDDPMDLVLMDGISTVSLLVTVNYQARDMSDTTFLDLVHACHRASTDTPSSLPLHFWITLYMFGFDWLGFTPTIIATPASSGFFCPI